AVIDRFCKTALSAAVRQPVAAPARNRHVRHVGVDLDTGHEAAGEAELARHGIVVDLVLGCDGGVMGLHAIGRHCEYAHDDGFGLAALCPQHNAHCANGQSRQAARTVARNFSTSTLSRLLSPESECADVRTWVEAAPVSLAPRLTSPILVATCAVPWAA